MLLAVTKNEEEEKEEEEEDNKEEEEEDDDTIPSLHCCVGHTAWAPEGREGRNQAGPKGPKPANNMTKLLHITSNFVLLCKIT